MSWRQPDLRIVDDIVDGPHGPVPIRLYAPARRTAGVVTWIHGGAFMTGGLDMNESHVVAAELAVRADVAVVTVDYRLARSGVRFPVPLDDAYAVWRWTRDTFAAGSAVTVLGGASAGATLAVAAAVRDRDSAVPSADALFLAYPYLHFPLPAPEPELAAALSANCTLPYGLPRRSARTSSATMSAASSTSRPKRSPGPATCTACRPRGSSWPNTTTYERPVSCSPDSCVMQAPLPSSALPPA